MAGPWEKYGGGAPAGGPVYGPPPKAAPPPTPFQVEDQQFQRQAQSRAEAAETRAREDQQFQREKFTFEREQAAKKAESGGDATESERKAAAFLIRALGSNDKYEAQNIGPRSLPGQMLADNAPNVLNVLPGGIGNSPERQVADTSQDEFIAASLRQDSGAAIPEEEMARQRRIYFPMPGDSPEAIEAKRMARLRAIEGLKQSAGRIAEGAIQRWQGMDGQQADSLDVRVTDDRPDDIELDAQGNPVQINVTDDAPPPPPSGGGINPDAMAIANDRRFYGDPNSLSGLGALARQGVTLGLSDEAAGAGGFLSELIHGRNPIDGYTRERDAARINLDRARDAWPVMGTLAELAGGGGGVRAVAGALPTVARMVGEGAAMGAVGGYGYGEGAEGSAINAGAGAAFGGTLAGTLAGVSRAYSARPRRAAPNVDQEVIAAGQAENIPIRQPDARPDLRNQMAEVDTSKYGGPMVREARAADEAAIEQRVMDKGGQGNPSDPYALGSKVQEAGDRYIVRTRAQAGRLYDKARQEAGGQTVIAKNADATLDKHITELKAAGENSNAGAIRYLEGLREDIDRGLTIEAAQSIRSNMRGQISERGLTGTDTERRVGEVVSAMTQDLADQLPQSASQALRAADEFYRGRQEFINGTLKQFMGSRGNPLPAETAASRLVSMTQGKGNYDRFSRMWKELAPEEQADVAATVAHSLGRKANGDFSVSTLVRSLDPSKGINPRTARLLFGEDGAKSLENLRIIARAKNETATALNNSRTGVVVQEAAGSLKTVLMGGLGFGAAGGPGAVAGVLGREFISKWGEQRAARMLLNPDFTKVLKNIPNTSNPKAVNAWLGRVAGISSIAANDNQAFANAVRASLGASPGRVSAASEQEQN